MICHPAREAWPRRENTEVAEATTHDVWAMPSEVAKLSGTPNSLIVTLPAVLRRPLRARRSFHESR
jgi:hypothetical protein